jgi:ribonuclease VapC
VLAFLRAERGGDRVGDLLPGALIGAVNLAEVHTKLVASGDEEQSAWWDIRALGCESAAFDEDQARIAGGLAAITRPLGLSLGDRACLALAIQRRATVYTTDRIWKSLALPIEVEVIR